MRLAGLQAQHEVVRMRILLLQVMTVVGTGEWNLQFLVDLQQAVIGDALMLQAIGLQFEIVILLAEDLPIFACRLSWRRPCPLPDEIGDFTAQAAGQRNEALHGALEESPYPSVAYSRNLQDTLYSRA